MSQKPVLVVMVGVVITGLWILDSFLEKAQRRAVEGQAKQSYTQGLRLLNSGRLNEAIESFQKAHALDRENVEYQLALIDVLVAGNRISRAEPLLNEILESDSNNGQANLIAARLMVKKRKFDQADAYYHRAIYGSWPSDASEHRRSARLELAEVLAKSGNRQELLAELLPVEAESGVGTETQKRLAHLFLIAGSPSRAADVYHALIKRNPEDGTAYAGLGEAQLQEGDYRLAHGAFLHASVHDPNNRLLPQLAALSLALSEMDPTPRWLPSLEKYRRSLHILDLARAAAEQCVKGQLGASIDTEKLLVAADDKISMKPPVHATNEMAEEVLGLAQKLWQARLKSCGPVSANEEALRLLMTKLGQ